MPNPYINKVAKSDGTVLIDLSGDTVTSAAHIVSGYVGHLADGSQVTGTGSGGGSSATLTTKTITANGTYDAEDDDADGYSSVTVNVPSKTVTGTFTTSSTTGAAQTVNIPYTGSGYPIVAMIYVTGGAYNTTSSGNSTWYNSTQRYAVGDFTMHKAEQNTAPTYTGSGSNNYGVCTCIYKNSTTNATTYSRSSGMTQATFNSSNASSQATNVIRFKSATQMSVFVAASSYGLLANTSYTYHVIYSA